jgi:hypothetical protein
MTRPPTPAIVPARSTRLIDEYTRILNGLDNLSREASVTIAQLAQQGLLSHREIARGARLQGTIGDLVTNFGLALRRPAQERPRG